MSNHNVKSDHAQEYGDRRVSNRGFSLETLNSSSPGFDVSSSDGRFTPEKHYAGVSGLTQCFQFDKTPNNNKNIRVPSPLLTRDLNARKINITTAFALTPKPVLDTKSNQAFQELVTAKVQKLYCAAKEAFENDAFEDCIIFSTKALIHDANNSEYYLLIGDAYLQLCDFQSAILNFKRVCILEPENEKHFSKLAFIYFLQGQCFFDEEMFLEALECFSRAAEMKPDVHEYHNKSIACLATLKRHKECLASINKRLEVDSDNSDLLIVRARLHLLFSNPTSSFFDVKEALALNPDNENADSMQQHLINNAEKLKNMALKLEIQGKLKEALMKISSAIDINPDVIQYHILRSSMHRHNHDYNAAVDDLLLVMEKCKQDGVHPLYIQAQQQLLLTFNDFAVHCFNKGFYEDAIVLLEKAIKNEKKNKYLYINRGDCFFKLGHFHFALLDYQQAEELCGNDGNIQLRLSVVYNEFALLHYSKREYLSAEEYFSLAISNNPGMALYYLSRARARYMQQHLEEAQVDVISALYLDRENKEIAAMFARLFSSETIDDVMESSFGQLVIEALRSVINEINCTDRQLNAEKPTLPSIVPSQTMIKTKLKECMNEKEFHIKIIEEKKKMSEHVESVIQNQQDLTNQDPCIKNNNKLIGSKKIKQNNWKSSMKKKSN